MSDLTHNLSEKCLPLGNCLIKKTYFVWYMSKLSNCIFHELYLLISCLLLICREWGFEKLVFRNSIDKVRRDRKYAIQARNAYSVGVHMSQNVKGRTTHKTGNLIKYYHYHSSINVMGEPCREFVPMPANGSKIMFDGNPYVYDDNMKRLAGEIKRFEKEAIGSAQT